MASRRTVDEVSVQFILFYCTYMGACAIWCFYRSLWSNTSYQLMDFQHAFMNCGYCIDYGKCLNRCRVVRYCTYACSHNS
ncbi:hypothetical protein GIB67_026554 [Kingdonia uniflora]|uniref:Uncharacterized protein n=1 Tax=Kingdonia uniflora TaxID=39325 RepID=A0A7J7PBQ8_9MAGN|nr:hypothetical protein GIB67_026554 [Kingdonia uniflora]